MDIKEKLCGNCKYYKTGIITADSVGDTKIVTEKKVCANNLSDEYDTEVAYEHSCDKWAEITEG